MKLSDEIKEEMKKLREEIATLKEQLTNKKEELGKSRGIYIDVGNRMHDYMEDMMESLAEGIHGELERSVFIGPRGIRIGRHKNGCHVHSYQTEPGTQEQPITEEANLPKAAEIMSALGQEHRLQILKELLSGGKYINELQEKLSAITTSTLSSHLNTLEEAGLVVQEKVRGRYLITIPGRTAYQMATKITKFVERRDEE